MTSARSLPGSSWSSRVAASASAAGRFPAVALCITWASVRRTRCSMAWWGVSRALWPISSAAIRGEPRRDRRSAASSISSATAPSGSTTARARWTARAPRSETTSANAACRFRESRAFMPSSTAVAINGCANLSTKSWSKVKVSASRPSRSASSSRSRPQGRSSTRPTAALSTGRDVGPATDSSLASSRVSAANPARRRASAASGPPPSGARGAEPARARASAIANKGFPCARSSICVSDAPSRAGMRSQTMLRRSAVFNPRTRRTRVIPPRSGITVASVSGSQVRKVAKSDTGSPTSRRSENRSTRRVRSSNQGRSSTAMTTGPRAARVCRRSRTSLEHSSADRSGPRARGVRSSGRCRGSNRSSRPWPRTWWSSWLALVTRT